GRPRKASPARARRPAGPARSAALASPSRTGGSPARTGWRPSTARAAACPQAAASSSRAVHDSLAPPRGQDPRLVLEGPGRLPAPLDRAQVLVQCASPSLDLLPGQALGSVALELRVAGGGGAHALAGLLQPLAGLLQPLAGLLRPLAGL